VKHSLKELMEIVDEEPAFAPQYLREWREELLQRKQVERGFMERVKSGAKGMARVKIELIDEFLGETE
jgi:hypothetical protein